MFFRILKKELKRKKGINIILFLFIFLATVFVASSVNNILAITNAVDYCMDKGNVPDKYIYTFEQEGELHLDDWLDGKGKKYYEDYVKNEAAIVSASNIKKYAGSNGKEYDAMNTIFIESQWKKYMQVFNQNQELLELKNGEIAMQQREMDKNGLKAGDKITLKFNDYEKEYTITQPMFDPSFGGEFIGVTRFIVSEDEYVRIKKAGARIGYNYCINTDNIDKFDRELNKQGLSIGVSLDRDTFEFSYVISMITSGILIIVGVCLIIISFLILKFTISFTLQEDYKEIGIMKAIGITNSGVRDIYTVKYFALSILAVTIGCLLSVPVSSIMIKEVAANVMMQKSMANLWVNIISSVVVILLILVFCRLSMRKLKKISPIDAIRSGETGERFKVKSGFKLYKHTSISTSFFLAINDICSNIRRYIVIILTFAIGTVLIILPLNTIYTMESTEMAKNFVLDTNADFYMNMDDSIGSEDENLTRTTVEEKINKIEFEMQEKGYDVSLNTIVFYSCGFYVDNEDDIKQFIVLQPINSDGSFIELTAGDTPKLDNEVALSEKVLDKLGISIGDTVHMKFQNEDFNMIVCGSYQNYMQVGESAFVSNSFDAKDRTLSGIWYFQGNVKNYTDKEGILEDLRNNFPRYTLYDYREAMNKQLGSTTEQLDKLKSIIVILICAINALITILMMKIFIKGETSQIAMMRSIGFSYGSIKTWQVMRMGFVLIIGVILGGVFSNFMNKFLVKPVFAMMGAAHIKIQVNVIETYIMYPSILLIVILIASYFAARSVRKINLMEINNME
ncbi:ABC transporter permease [Clostridium sp. MSJ-8]|uniref:ABC transporter permease n=1 Tax=Clostridium sp. MSJ-8 TaxID=2841510 RepID=UPI001C0F3AD6|nr:ABC transporter permease [Clostridium sp. MSJ-8]MBU5486576.1 ABC transporter permease [Clostridium sp. MSJ-8]